MRVYKKIIVPFALIIWVVLFVFSVRRDMQMIEQDGFGDLRNRVVGARLIKDGKSPYWYKWETGSGTRYYDRWNISPLKATNITASPFFLHLMQPLAEIDQKSLSKLWLLVEYLTYFLIVAIALLQTSFWQNKNVLLFAPLLLFFLTVCWVAHTSVGQNYLFTPLLLLMFFSVFNKSNKHVFLCGFICGLLVVVSVLIRPTLVLFFIPFLFMYKNTNRQFVTAAFMPVVLTFIWLVIDKKEQLYWKDYGNAIVENIKFHQDQNPTARKIDIPPSYIEVEGVNLEKSVSFKSAMAKKGVVLQFQTASVYKNFTGVFHKKIPVSWLNNISIVCCVLLVFAWWLQQRHIVKTDIFKAALTGFCLYFITDIFSPVLRGQYSAVAWLFPLAILPVYYKPNLKVPCIVFFTGFGMNIFYFKISKMQYAIGEYLMFIALLLIIFFPRSSDRVTE